MEKITKHSLSLSETSMKPSDSLFERHETDPKPRLWDYIESPKRNNSNDQKELNIKLFPKEIEK